MVGAWARWDGKTRARPSPFFTSTNACSKFCVLTRYDGGHAARSRIVFDVVKMTRFSARARAKSSSKAPFLRPFLSALLVFISSAGMICHNESDERQQARSGQGAYSARGLTLVSMPSTRIHRQRRESERSQRNFVSGP